MTIKDGFLAINKKPVFEKKRRSLNKNKSEESTPALSTQKFILFLLRKYSELNRQEIISHSALNGKAVTNTLRYLVAEKRISKDRKPKVFYYRVFDGEKYLTAQEGVKLKKLKLEKAIYEVIKKHRGIRKKTILTKVYTNMYFLNNALNSLLSKKKITRNIVAHAGEYNVYSYEAKEL